MSFINEEIKKSKSILGLLKTIQDNQQALKSFGMEVKIYKDGVELES
ncbi:hypothetical protein [Flagellimonas lutimaris]